MAPSAAVRWIAIVVLVIVGVYMGVFHQSHEAVGLGNNHLAHTVVGIVFLVAAGYLWWTGRGKATATPAK